MDELVQLGQHLDVQQGLEAHAPGIGQLQVQDHSDGCESARGDAALEQPAHHGPNVRQGEEAELERGAYPETYPRDDNLLPVLLRLYDRLRPVDEEGARHQEEVAGHHRAGDGAEEGGDLGQEGHRDEYEACAVSNSAGCHPSRSYEGNYAGVDDVGYGAGQAGHEITCSTARQGPLHLPEVDGFALSPCHPLKGNGFPGCLDGEDDPKKQEGGQQGPEGDAKVQPQAWG